MFPHRFEVGHIPRQQQDLLHRIDHITRLAPRKSLIEASLGRGAPSNVKGGAQIGAATCWLPLLSPSLDDLVYMPLGCLALL